MKFLLVFPFCLLASVVLGSNDEGEELRVETRLSNGSPLRGYVIRREKRLVRAFRGVPYARPPRRFQPADIDVPPWTEVRDARRPGASCPGGEWSAAGDEQPVSEDCLFVDVYVDPGCLNTTNCSISLVLKGADSRRIKDDFVIGHNKSDPEVMIFLNHRFGVFGFLDVGDEDAAEFPYNVGLQDVIQALRWIKREARAFNGDPDRLTAYVFRDSATLVQLLLVSPAVQREEMPMDRILLNNHRPLLQPHANRQPTARLLESVGCAVDEDGRPLDSKQKVACLRSKSMEELWRQSPGQHAFGPQTDARLLPAESFAELVANWKPSSVYTISGENVPFAEDRGRSVDELCRLYAAHTFGYRSAAVAQRCAWRYASLPNGAALIGRHAAHAMNALLGARNNRSGGTTFAARFAQPTEDGGDFRFIFADHQPETAAEHRVHEFMLETREQFGHRRRAPAADFLPVDAEGRNFYDVRAETAEDGRTLMAEPRMYVGAWPDADGVDFWLRELRDVEAASRAATRTPRPTRLHAVDPPEAAQEGSWDEHPAAALWMVVAVVVLLLAAFLWVLDRKYQRKEVVGGKKATVRRSYASFDEI